MTTPRWPPKRAPKQARLEQTIAELEATLTPLLLPRDPLDDRNAIVEIRAGTGGDEAALFAADLYPHVHALLRATRLAHRDHVALRGDARRH